MTNYDVAVTNATEVITPPSPPPAVNASAGSTIFNPNMVKQPGTGQLEQAQLQQQAPNPAAANNPAQMANPATGMQMLGQQPAMGQQAWGNNHQYSSYGNNAYGKARTLSDSEFRKLLGKLSSGHGGLRSFPRMSSGGGIHRGGAVASGLGGTGTAPGSLGLRAGATPAVPAAVFGGVPTSAPPPQAPAAGSPMMSPLGGARGIKNGADDRHSAHKVLEYDSWIQQLLPQQMQVAAPTSETTEQYLNLETGEQVST